MSGYDAKFSFFQDRERLCEGQFDSVVAGSPVEVQKDCVYGQAEYCDISGKAVVRYFRQRISVADQINPLPKKVEIKYICSS